MVHILYNPLSNNKKAVKGLKKLLATLKDKEINMVDITNTDISDFLNKKADNDTIILTGGDGTLNHFVNDLGDEVPEYPIYFYPSGSGNDFIRDLEEPLVNGMICLNPYIKNLPVINVNGKNQKFLNGCGYGIDGYACDECERIKKKYNLKINYAVLALKGILFDFKPSTATVCVDGNEFTYENVWMAPAMKGKYFGGGVKIAPMQDRLNEDHSVTVVFAHCKSPLKLLFVYPSIFKGKHVKYTNIVQFHTGHDITVSFDKPTALQIDGEVVRDVLTYRVTAK